MFHTTPQHAHISPECQYHLDAYMLCMPVLQAQTLSRTFRWSAPSRMSVAARCSGCRLANLGNSTLPAAAKLAACSGCSLPATCVQARIPQQVNCLPAPEGHQAACLDCELHLQSPLQARQPCQVLLQQVQLGAGLPAVQQRPLKILLLFQHQGTCPC
eukprot:351893-Chlamydomonas_euryale.AAC.15